MSHYDHYSVAKDIARRLAEAGHPDWKERLEDAMAAGATGTEICMALRWNLRNLLRSKIKIDTETRAQVNELISKLNSALKWK